MGFGQGSSNVVFDNMEIYNGKYSSNGCCCNGEAIQLLHYVANDSPNDITIKNSWVHDAMGGLNLAGTNLKIYNNIFSNIGTGNGGVMGCVGDGIIVGGGQGPYNNMQIYNNTLYNNSDGANCALGGGDTVTYPNTFLKNNLLYQNFNNDCINSA